MGDVIRGIVKAKWGDALKVDEADSETWVIGEYPFGVTVWFDKDNRLEFRKLHGCELSWWIQIHVQESIAKHYKGWCKDEGVSGRWRGKPEKYPTFKSYWDLINQNIPEAMRDYFWKAAITGLPQELLCTESPSARA